MFTQACSDSTFLCKNFMTIICIKKITDICAKKTEKKLLVKHLAVHYNIFGDFFGFSRNCRLNKPHYKLKD